MVQGLAMPDSGDGVAMDARNNRGLKNGIIAIPPALYVVEQGMYQILWFVGHS